MNFTENNNSNTNKKVYKKHNQNMNNNNMNNNNNNSNNSSNNNNGNKKATTFQDAVVAKSDVGEFAGGYFIMPGSEQDNLKLKKPNIHYQKNSPQRKKLPPTVNQFEQQKQHETNDKQNSSNNNITKTPKKEPQLKILEPIELLLTPAFLQKESSFTSENSTPVKGKFNTPPSRNSPNKKVSSPTNSAPPCWAGGAFNNSPSPSSLPIPNFDDDDEPSETISQVDLQSITFDLRRLLNITPTISVSDS